MKTFIIQEKFVGYAEITIEAETEQEAIDLYNEGSYDDNAEGKGATYAKLEILYAQNVTKKQVKNIKGSLL